MENSKKLRILAASDIHGDTKLAGKLARKAEKENVDLVVLCGDITGLAETKNLIKPFVDAKKKVLLVPGNWDDFATADFFSSFYKVRNLHGSAAIYEGVGFFGAGGANNSPGPGRVTEREILSNLEEAHSQLKSIEKKIMITHVHPSGSKSEFSGVKGSEAVRKAIKKFKPYLVLHGHIHEAFGIEEEIYGSHVVNVGREGKVFEIVKK